MIERGQHMAAYSLPWYLAHPDHHTCTHTLIHNIWIRNTTKQFQVVIFSPPGPSYLHSYTISKLIGIQHYNYNLAQLAHHAYTHVKCTAYYILDEDYKNTSWWAHTKGESPPLTKVSNVVALPEWCIHPHYLSLPPPPDQTFLGPPSSYLRFLPKQIYWTFFKWSLLVMNLKSVRLLLMSLDLNVVSQAMYTNIAKVIIKWLFAEIYINSTKRFLDRIWYFLRMSVFYHVFENLRYRCSYT